MPSVERRPLRLISNKSCSGHTEGAAGLTGLLLAAASASQCSMPPVMHLRAWNAHVAAALDSWRSQSRLAASVPLQQAGELAEPFNQIASRCALGEACAAQWLRAHPEFEFGGW